MARRAAKHLVINDNRLTEAIVDKAIYDKVFKSTKDDWLGGAQNPQCLKRWLIVYTSYANIAMTFFYSTGVMNKAQNLLVIKNLIVDHVYSDYEIRLPWIYSFSEYMYNW